MTGSDTFWSGKQVLVTGGASFIGSTLTDQLLERGAKVRVVDDLTSGHLDNLKGHTTNGRVEFIHADLREPGVTRSAVQGVDTVFHLAADHGGRGYVDLHQAGPASNFFLDGLVFAEALRAKVKKVVFASSGCVYPNFMQADVKKELYLTEDLTNGPNDADNTYGWAKLMGEFTLRAYAKEHGMGAASCRYFTVYGPRGVENHAVIAMIARAFIKQEPFVVWGTGEQIRNWTYIDDIVRGTILAAEKIDDGTAVMLEHDLADQDREFGSDAQAWRSLVEPLVNEWVSFVHDALGPVVRVPSHPVLMARFGLAAFQPARRLANSGPTRARRSYCHRCASHRGCSGNSSSRNRRWARSRPRGRDTSRSWSGWPSRSAPC